MAIDDSPPRNKLILAYAAVSVVLLIGLKLGLDWYFLDMTEAERARSVSVVDRHASPIGQQRAREATALDEAPTSLEAAIQAIEQRGRVATDDIAPTPSSDLGAVTGWNGFDLIEGAHPAGAAAPPAPSPNAPPAPEPAPAPAPSAPAPGAIGPDNLPLPPAPAADAPAPAANAPAPAANAPAPGAAVPTKRAPRPAPPREPAAAPAAPEATP